MTPTKLKQKYNEIQGGLFFSKETMNHFGDTMGNYAVKLSDCKKLWKLYRKSAVKDGLKSNAYFDRYTFKFIPVESELLLTDWTL